MKTPDLPLIQPALKKAPTERISGDVNTSTPNTSAPRTSGGDVQRAEGPRASASSAPSFTVTVSSSKPSSDGGYQVTVNSGRQSLTINSAQPFPAGTELELTTTSQQPPQVQIVGIRLPASQSGLAAQLQSMATKLQQTALAGTPVSGNPTQPGQPSRGSLPAVIQALLTARASGQAMLANSANGQMATSGLPLSALQAGAYSPERARSGSTVTATTGSPQTTAPLANGQRPATTSTSTTPDYPALLRNLMSDVKGSPLQSAPRQVLDNLPALLQLATPAGVKAAVSQSPLSYENQLLQAAAMAGKRAGMTSSLSMSKPAAGQATTVTPDRLASGTGSGNSTSVKELFQSLWQRAGQSMTVNTGPAAAAAATSASASASVSTSVPSSALAQMPERLSLLDTIQILQKQASGEASKEAPPGTMAALLAPLLNSTSAAAPLPVDNLKGLLLFLLGKTQGGVPPSNHASTTAGSPTAGNAVSGAAGMTEMVRPETLRLLQTALSQTENEQVRLIQTQDNSQFQVPLLWRQDDSVKQSLLCLNREHEDGTQSDDEQKKRSRWQITLHFDLEQTGPLDVELDLCPPTLSATFWSEQQDTLADIQQTLQPLRERLTELGAEVSELRARHGRKPPGTQPVIRHSLVDVHT